jgi:hypothetical protein
MAMRIGISDLDGSPGGCAPEASEPGSVSLGSLAAGSPWSERRTFAAGAPSRLYRLDLAASGWLALRVCSPGASLRLTPLGPNLARDFEASVVADPGVAAEVRRPVPAGPLHFEVSPTAGERFPAAGEWEVAATLAELPRAPAGNDAPARAQGVRLPFALVSDGRHSSDWYAFEIAVPTSVDIVTRPCGFGGVARAPFLLFDPRGPAFGHGSPYHSRPEAGGEAIRHLSLEIPGRYTIRVDAWGTVSPGYLLEARAVPGPAAERPGSPLVPGPARVSGAFRSTPSAP